MSTSFALVNVSRLSGTPKANRTAPSGVTGQKTLVPTPMPPMSAW